MPCIIRMTLLSILAIIPLLSSLASPLAAQPADDAAQKAARAAVDLSRLEASGDFSALYDQMHPDAQAVVPREVVAGWYLDYYAYRTTTEITVTDVRFVEWTWPVTGVTYPTTAEISFMQPIWEGGTYSEVHDVLHLVQNNVGEWSWFFGSSREFVDEQIAIYADSTGDVVVPSQAHMGIHDLGIIVLVCEREPVTYPFQGGDCRPATGALITATTLDGTPVDSCTVEPDLNDVTDGCTLSVALGSTVVLTQDPATVPAGYAPSSNPQILAMPNVLPDGFGGPVFLSLPINSSESDGGVADSSGTGRTLTILSALCPSGYAGNASSDECDNSPITGVPFRIGRPFTDSFTEFLTTDGEGLVSFEFDGLPLDGALRIIEELPPATVRIAVYCVDESGFALGITYAEYTESNSSLGVVDVSVGETGDVACDWYNIPAPSGDEAHGDISQTSGCTALEAPDRASNSGAMYRGNSARTGEQPGPGPQGVPVPDEVFLSGRKALDDAGGLPICGILIEEGTPLIATEGVVYVGGEFHAPTASSTSLPGGNSYGLIALDGTSGAVRWFAPISAVRTQYFTGPAMAAGTVYVATGHDLYSFNAETGDEGWTFRADGFVDTSPVVADGSVYISTADGVLHALDAATGQQRWRLWLGDWRLTAPAVAEGVIYIGSQDGALYAIDAATGAAQWRFETSGQVLDGPAVTDGLAYITSSDSTIHAVDVESGTERWRAGIPTSSDAVDTNQSSLTIVSSPAVADDAVYVGGEGYLLAFDALSGSERWRLQTDGTSLSSPSVVDDTVYTVSVSGTLYAVDTLSGTKHWGFSAETMGSYGADGSPAVLPAPAVMDGTVYFLNVHGVLYAVTGSGNP